MPDAAHEYPTLREGRAGEELFAERGAGEFLEFARRLYRDERALVGDEHQLAAAARIAAMRNAEKRIKDRNDLSDAMV